MKKSIIAAVLLAATAVFGQTTGSREGDSLALVAIKKANPGSTFGTLTGPLAWIASNPISSWYRVVIDTLSGRVTSLYFDGEAITTLPAEIGDLTNLTVLGLERNQLTTLPAEIGDLTNLSQLDLNNNQLTTLPAEIGKLTNLTELDLSYNLLNTLPAEIVELTNLNALGLDGNQLTTLSPEIGKLTNLIQLELRGNQLTTLPAEIGKLTNLGGLGLSGNQLTTLPAEIGELTNLNALGLEGNQLNTLPAEIGKLTKLHSLFLSNNQLNTLPAEFGNLTTLSYLDLSNNLLITLPLEITNLINISEDTVGVYDYYGSYFVNFHTLFVCNNYLTASNLDSLVVQWLDKFACPYDLSIDYAYRGWLSTQKDPATPVVPVKTAITTPLAAMVSGNTIKLTRSLPAGSVASIVTLSGRQVAQKSFEGSTVGIGDLARGVYLVRINSGAINFVQKIMVQ